MTAIDALSSPDALALLAAIDEGDAVALSAPADLLEGAGDARAVGLRRAARSGHRPGRNINRTLWVWLKESDWGAVSVESHNLPDDAFDAIVVEHEYDNKALRYRHTRSDAYLALAEALTND